MAAPLPRGQRIKPEARVARSAHNSKEIPEWHDQLSAAANAISPSLFDAETLKHRAELQSRVKTTPESPEAWHAYLCLLNNERKRHATHETASYMHATLVALYDRATSIIPLIRVNRHSEIYLDIWLDLASLRAEDAEDAYLARETFKYMKRECIGLAYPKFWYAWADLEERLGNYEKAEEHRRKGRARESGGTPASVAKPPNPVSTRRPLRPPRRANDTHNENHPSDVVSDPKIADSSEMNTPVTSTVIRAGRVPSSAERNVQSPALSNWTPAMRENPSPLVKSTPEPSLIRPTDAGVLDNLSKYYSHKRNTPAPEKKTEISEAAAQKPVETPSSQTTGQTPLVRRDVRNTGANTLSESLSRRTPVGAEARDHNIRQNNFSSSFARQAPTTREPPLRSVYDVLGTTSRRKDGQGNPRVPRSSSFQDGSKDEQLSAQKRWNSSAGRQPPSVAKPSPLSSSFSIPRSQKAFSPEVLRSGQTRGEHRPSPNLFSQSELSSMKENYASSRVNLETRRDHDSLRRKAAISSNERQLHKLSDSDGGRQTPNSSPKRERHDESDSDRLEQSRYSKRTPGAPVPLSRNARVENSSAQKRETQGSSPLLGVSPSNPFSRQSDSSSSATPAMEREQHRRRMQSPRQQAFLREFSRDRYVSVNGKQYLILELIGKGGSSRVYKVMSDSLKIMALKRVKVQMTSGFMVTLNSYANEIDLLKKLRGSPSIVQLYDSEVNSEMGLISLVMECGDIDLAKRLSTANGKPTIREYFRRDCWEQMLEAVHTIHEARIVHGDLKPANFLIVSGTLKLIDFGIAKAIQTEDTTKIVRESQQGTPNYISPEALKASAEAYFDDMNNGESDGRSHKSQYRVGRASDIWSLGCILYQMVYGRPPFAHISNVYTKLTCIQDPNHEISYRPVGEPLVIDVLKGCLQRDPTKRMSIPQLLKHPYINSTQKRVVIDAAPSDLSTRMAGDPRLMVRSSLEAVGSCGYFVTVTSASGDQIAVRTGDRAYERMLDAASRKITMPQISMGQWDNGNNHGRDRSFGLKNQLLTPTTSAITNQASRTGITGNKTGTGTLNENKTGTKTGERNWN